MSEPKSFDPYHQWLGIPKSEQPPNHYRLLGLGMFEEDADVIDTAADRAMSFLQQCATGEHVAESQTLLNEVSQARLKLLNPKQKAAYDQHLKKTLYKDLVEPEPDPLPRIEVENEPVSARVSQRKKSGRPTKKQSRGRKRRNPMPLKIAAAFAGLVVFGLIVLAVLPPDEQTPSGKQTGKTTAKSKTTAKTLVAKAEQKTPVKPNIGRPRNPVGPVGPRIVPVINPGQVGVMPAPDGVDLNRGLVGFYPFEREPHPFADASGTGADGRAVGGAGFTGGKFGQGLAVSKTHEYQFEQAGIFDCNRPFSFSIWCRSGPTGLVFSRQKLTPSQCGYSLGLRDGDLIFSLVEDATMGNMIRATAQIDLGGRPQFHLLTVTYDGSGRSEGISLYFNGRALEQTLLPSKVAPAEGIRPETFRIGKHAKRPGVFGIVDDLLIYDRELEQAEVEFLARGGRPASKLAAAVAVVRNPKVNPIEIPPDADANRKAALWVLGNRGSVRIIKPGERRSMQIRNAAMLPDEPFHVVQVDSANVNLDIAEGLKLLADAPALEHLTMVSSDIQDEHCESIAGCRNLKFLAISRSKVTDAGLAKLGTLSELRTLHLDDCESVQGSAFGQLSELRSLTTLHLNRTAVDDSAMEHIAKLPQIKTLQLAETKITDNGLKAVLPLTDLMTLALGGTAVTDDGVQQLGPLTELRSLGLSKTSVSDVGVKVVSQMKLLVYLHLSETRVTGKTLPLLSSCTQLNQVDLNGLPIEDSDLATLAQLPNLFRLNLDRTKVTDAGVQSFSKTPRLVYLSVKETGVTGAGSSQLKQTKPNLRVYFGN